MALPFFQRANVRIFSLQFHFLYIERANNIVSLFKQYCLTCQTQVFDFPNNIVSSAEVKCSEEKTLDLHF